METKPAEIVVGAVAKPDPHNQTLGQAVNSSLAKGEWSLARTRFWLLCARARSDQAENLHVLLKLAVLSFLFS